MMLGQQLLIGHAQCSRQVAGDFPEDCVGVGWKSLYMDKERRKGLADWTSDGVKLRAQNQG